MDKFLLFFPFCCFSTHACFGGNCDWLIGVNLTGREQVAMVDWGNWYSGQLKGSEGAGGFQR